MRRPPGLPTRLAAFVTISAGGSSRPAESQHVAVTGPVRRCARGSIARAEKADAAIALLDQMTHRANQKKQPAPPRV